MVRSAYLFSSFKARLTSLMLAPSFCVFAKIVCVALICVSYSCKPVVIGSIVKAETIFLPAFNAEFVIFVRAVTAMTSSAENFNRTDSTPPASPPISTEPAALLMFSKPFALSSNLRLFFSLSSVDMLVLTFFSKFALSNRISTTLWSIVLLIAL